MKFRPCIDIHNGKVKQIVGSSLRDSGDRARENFVADRDAAYYAQLYQAHGLAGGHVILLNAADSPYFEATRQQALAALAAYPGGLQVGGGITTGNAADYLSAGASHVIVSSYVFRNGQILQERLDALVRKIGAQHLVLDLSCKKVGEDYRIVTDRWQTTTQIPVNQETLERLSSCCDEFLIHAVDVEGKNSGIETELLSRLSVWQGRPITYAGGVHSMEDLERIRSCGQGRIDVTIGTALDLFGGRLSFESVAAGFSDKKSG